MASDKKRLFLVIGSFVIGSFALRLAPLGRYVTPDEPAWVYRSIRFADALVARDWSAIPSTGHPGVTTMWLGAMGVAVKRLLDPGGSAAHLEWIRHLAWLAPENGEAFRRLAFFLPFGRVAVALVTSLALLVVYGLAGRLFGRRTALVAVGLLACDPLLVGHSGLLHTDALLATFSSLSLLLLLMAARGGQRAWAWSLASGAAAGLALLTKSLGVFLLPFAAVVLGSAWLLRRARLQQAAFSLLLWGLALAGAFAALYPAVWVAPWKSVEDMFHAPTYHATAALMPTFFAGKTALQHGPEFYAVALPFRLSPVVLVGVALSIRVFIREKPLRPNLAWLWLFTASYLLLLALNVKKYDRYLLPVFAPLTLAAAIPLSKIASPLHEASSSTSPCPLVLSYLNRLKPFLPILLQLLILLPFAAHPLTYFNPLLGGPPVAVRLLPLDWGEGMGAAARWLSRLPGADQLTVAAVNVPSFASTFSGRTVSLDRAPLADYLALGPDRPADQPSYTITLGLLDHAAVYTNTAPEAQAAYLSGRAGPDDLILLDADTPLLRRYEGPGTLLSAASLPDEPAVADLVAGAIPGHGSIWVLASPGASAITAAHLQRQVKALATPVSTAAVASATLTQFTPRFPSPDTSPTPFRAAFGGQLALVDGALPGGAAWPSPLQVVLRWQASSAPPGDYRAVVTLRDRERQAWSTGDLLVLDEVTFPTSAWTAGAWADVSYELSLPAGIPPDAYTVEVGLYDQASGAGLGAAGPDGSFLGTQVVVGEVTVTPPERPAHRSALDVAQDSNIRVGPLTLLGLEPPPEQVLSGDCLPCTLFWQADAAPRADYRVRLRLADAAGGGGLETVAPLSPYPTSQWQAGDRFQSRHCLHVLPDLPPGSYALTLNVLEESHPLWEVDQLLADVKVLPRERTFELPDVSHPMDLTFGEVVHLRGYGLSIAEAAPGGSLPLALYWQAKGPADQDYTLFVHLLGPDGLPHGQVDRTPGGGAAPTSSWAAGQVIVEEIVLPVAADAPPGTYHIAVGFYDVAYGSRLPVADAVGQALPNDQAILPVEVTIGDPR